MPLYPYRCTACGYRFEKIQSFSAEAEKVCPNCGKETLIRPLTAPRLQFKGAGWYVNDYASKGAEASSEGSPTEAKSTETKESAKSDAAPASPSAPSAPAPSKPSSDT